MTDHKHNYEITGITSRDHGLYERPTQDVTAVCECGAHLAWTVPVFALDPGLLELNTSLATYGRIPAGIWNGIRRYVDHHSEVGDFLTAVLSNNLTEAFARADVHSTAAMHAIMTYLYNEVPSTCWGSPERVAAWLQMEATDA